MAYSREQLMTALRNADAAGDTEGARRIAQILSSSNQPTQNQKQPVEQQDGFMSDLGEAVKETGRGLVQAGVNVANIPASVADAVTSAAAWAGGKLG
ncbi:TPA: DNA transfer protein, partial [Escherichia coli]